MLHARTVEEAFLYLDMHPCACGQVQFDGTHELLAGEKGTVLRITGRCPSCDVERHYEFTLEPVDDQTGRPRTPSTLLDAAEFVWLSDRAAGRVPADTGGLTQVEAGTARENLQRAVELLYEVIAFIPEGGTEVSPSSITSTTGKVLLVTEPGRFSLTELTQRIGLYQRKIAQLSDQVDDLDHQTSGPSAAR